MNDLADPVLGGMLGAAMLAALAYGVRAVAGHLLSVLARAYVVRVTVSSEDQVYGALLEWLSSHPYAARAKILRLASVAEKWQVTPGYGWHLLWDGGPVAVHRALDKDAPASLFSNQAKEVIEIMVPGRDQRRVRDLLARIASTLDVDRSTKVFYWQGYWHRLPKKHVRSLDSVVMSAGDRAKLLRRSRKFFASRDRYRSTGTPWRFGVLIEGGPGTGKTSLAVALAGALGKNLYMLNLAAVEKGDAELLGAVQNVGDGIVLLDELDTVQATRRAEPSAPPQPETTSEVPPQAPSQLPAAPAKTSVSIGGLRGALDGPGSAEGYILVMTTSHADKLDAALVRKGRVNLNIKMGPLGPSQVHEMALKFFPGDTRRADAAAVAAGNGPPLPASEWQEAFLEDWAQSTMEADQ